MKKIIILMIISAVFISSCIDNPTGLFYSVEKENEIYESQMEDGDSLTIGGMCMKNGYYFIAAGSPMYRSTADGSTWYEIMPTGLTNYKCYKMVNLDDIYGIFYENEDLTFKIFKLNSANPSSSGWTEIDFSGSAVGSDESIIDIQSAGSFIFLYTSRTADTTETTSGYAESRYALYSTPSTNTLSTVPTLTAELSGLTSGGEFDIDYDGSAYWMISGNKFYTGDTGTFAEVNETSLTTVLDANDEYIAQGYRGLLCDGTDIYLSTAEGMLLKRSGGTWTDLTSSEVLEAPLYDLKRITSGDIDVILLGASPGYYEMDLNAASPEFVFPEDADTILTNKTDFSSIDLSGDSVVLDFFQDSSIVFALGYNAGLWRNYDNDGERTWDIE